MNRWKKNISLWSLGLALLLVAAALVGATGTTLARYRAEATEPITFTARPVRQFLLGQLVTGDDGGVSFDPEAQGAWEQTESGYRLTFAVSNILGEDTVAQEDQRIFLRLVGTPGVWDGTDTVNITLLMPAEDVPEEETENSETTENTENTEAPTEPAQTYDTFPATATRISGTSPMYGTFGDGWVFSFLDEEGNERGWLLEGGTPSMLEMTLILEGAALTDPSLLQLQVSGE